MISTLINTTFNSPKKNTFKNIEDNYEPLQNEEDMKSNIEMPPQRDIRDAQPTISVNYRVVKNIEENNLKRNQIMYEERSNLESAMFQTSYLNKESFDELEKSEAIASFDDIAENVFNRLNVSLNSDIYINFLALRRIGQHYKEIKFLKDNLGQILKK